MPAFISRRVSIRWIPESATEPTDTIVLTGEGSYFLDARFLKIGGGLDWAFAGRRIAESPDCTRFVHLIDSRTLDAEEVVDQGTNIPLPNGTTLEKGTMVNPETGKMTDYEEIWEDIDHDCGNGSSSLFLRSDDSRTWQARVGDYETAMGRHEDGAFWAWRAKRSDGNEAWKLIRAVGDGPVNHLPGPELTKDWELGTTVNWSNSNWTVLDKS
ncbi:hypothetical protein HGRIS_010296 [Hohenbuehelia grisea]|uniref:Protein HRI1 n=1 Tax=Hohenbuehelia grisea TaxID=104357 RepID=A0ABR3J3V5_9AGAR